MRQAHHQFKVYSDLKVLVLIHLNHLSSVTLRGKCSSLWHRHNRCSEWWNFLFSGFQLTASSSFKMTRTVSSASNIACFIMRKANLKKIEKKKTPKEGFILDLSELMRSVRIVSIARKLSLWKTDFHPFSSKSEIRLRKWFWYVYCYLHEGKKKVLKLSMVTYQFVTGSYIMSEIKNKTIYVLLVHMHLATLVMANSVIIIFWQPFTPFD